MAQYIALCRFWTKFENLKCEIHENRMFSFFLRVVCAKIEISSMVYFLRFFKICPSANNPEEFEVLNVRIVHCTGALTITKTTLVVEIILVCNR